MDVIIWFAHGSSCANRNYQVLYAPVSCREEVMFMHHISYVEWRKARAIPKRSVAQIRWHQVPGFGKGAPYSRS